MTFRDIIERVNGSRATLTVLDVDAPPRAVEQVAAYLGPQQVRFRTDGSETGLPTNLAVLHQDETFVAASRFEDVYGYLTTTYPGDGVGGRGSGRDSTA